MLVTIQLFAGARDAVGSPTVEVELPQDATPADAEHALVGQFPRLAELLGRSLWAVDGQYAERTTIIPAGADIALIPPVSGG